MHSNPLIIAQRISTPSDSDLDNANDDVHGQLTDTYNALDDLYAQEPHRRDPIWALALETRAARLETLSARLEARWVSKH